MMKQLEMLAMGLLFGAASLVAPLAAADNAAHAQREGGEHAAAPPSARIALEADRVYSFVEPRDGRLTALLIANGRPSATVSIDQAGGMVDVTATDGRSERYAVAELADAYAAGDAERRAAFLVSLQRTASANDAAAECAATHCAPWDDAAWAGDGSTNEGTSRQDRSAKLAAVARWAADHVGSQRSLAQFERATGAARSDGIQANDLRADSAQANAASSGEANNEDSERHALFDPWQAGMQVPEWLRALGDVFRPWR